MKSTGDVHQIPLVDLFAGPGGLGEGFARFPYRKPSESRFLTRLSIEKDPGAHETLRLRSFTRQFPWKKLPNDYYKLLKQIERPVVQRISDLFDAYPREAECADEEAICAELGNPEFEGKIAAALRHAVGKERDWVLLGGPPCQAYSLVGRSRNKGIENYRPEEDQRHFLYLEYLNVIADHLPSVFVMENVKGLLSATVRNERIFTQIVQDLHAPRKSLGKMKSTPKGLKTSYRLFALGGDSHSQKQPRLFDVEDEPVFSDFVVRMENHGIPQARHRLIIIGVREDLGIRQLPKTLELEKSVDVNEVLGDLPRLRSGLSREHDESGAWCHRVAEAETAKWFRQLRVNCPEIVSRISDCISVVNSEELGRGAEWLSCSVASSYKSRWYSDRKIQGVFNHVTRGHITEDLHRYLYASCFAEIRNVSPALREFPTALLPDHRNVKQAIDGSLFGDRFRVQLADRPSTTITSHISKDGHYYIHYDPSQCRSLTVREAARLQTFPDNYFFCGPRTSQFIQVGNAVPPLFAHQIADVVEAIFLEAGIL